MMKFYAREGHMLPLPNQNPANRRRYYGRTSEILRAADGSPAGILHRPHAEPFEVDENSQAAQELIRSVKLDQSLVPADEATAALCGVKFFKPTAAQNGEWSTPQPERKKRAHAAPADSKGSK